MVCLSWKTGRFAFWGEKSRLGLYCLEFRKMVDDFIETYRILSGFNRVNAGRMLPLAEESTIRSHSQKIGRGPARKVKYFFTQSLIYLWNFQPQSAGEAQSFQTNNARFLDIKRIKGYGKSTGEWSWWMAEKAGRTWWVTFAPNSYGYVIALPGGENDSHKNMCTLTLGKFTLSKSN